MYKNIFIVFLVLIGSVGCINKSKQVLIPKKDFKEILTDIHLADGIYSINYGKFNFHNDSINFYRDIVKSYGYTFAQFDSTLHWYTTYPEELDKIYTDLITEFSKFEHEVSQMEFVIRDTTLNLFKTRQKWVLPKDGLTKRIPFDIAVEDSSEYKIIVMAKRFDDDESEDLRITAYYWYKDSISDKEHKIYFPEVNIEKEKRFKLYTTSKYLASKKVKRLRGWILNHDNASEHFKKHVEVKFIAIRKLKLEIL